MNHETRPWFHRGRVFAEAKTRRSKSMSKSKRFLMLMGLVALLPLTLFAAGSTAVVQSTTAGLKITAKTTDKLGFHDATPTAQQTGVDQTAFAALAVKGLIAPAAVDYSVQHRKVSL